MCHVDPFRNPYLTLTLNVGGFQFYPIFFIVFRFQVYLEYQKYQWTHPKRCSKKGLVQVKKFFWEISGKMKIYSMGFKGSYFFSSCIALRRFECGWLLALFFPKKTN